VGGGEPVKACFRESNRLFLVTSSLFVFFETCRHWLRLFQEHAQEKGQEGRQRGKGGFERNHPQFFVARERKGGSKSGHAAGGCGHFAIDGFDGWKVGITHVICCAGKTPFSDLVRYLNFCGFVFELSFSSFDTLIRLIINAISPTQRTQASCG